MQREMAEGGIVNFSPIETGPTVCSMMSISFDLADLPEYSTMKVS